MPRHLPASRSKPVRARLSKDAVDAQKKLGYVLRDLRLESGLTQEKLGFAAGITKNYVSDVENGRRNPTVKVLARWLVSVQATWTAFGVRYDEALAD